MVAAVCVLCAFAPTRTLATAPQPPSPAPSAGNPQPQSSMFAPQMRPFLTKPSRAGTTQPVPRASVGTPLTTASVTGGTAIYNNLSASGAAVNEELNCCSPPDTTGAVGPNHYVEFVNSLVKVYDRTLGLVNTFTLNQLNGATCPNGSVCSQFDVQIQWDQQAGRWVYAMVDEVLTNSTASEERLAYGWTKGTDPSLTTNWCNYTISNGNSLPDYPKLGHDDNFVYVGINNFQNFGNGAFTTAEVFAIPKPASGPLLTCASGPTLCVSTGSNCISHFGTPCQYNGSGCPGTVQLQDSALVPAFTPVPVNTTDSFGSGYIVAAAGYSGNSGTKLAVWQVIDTAGTPSLTALADYSVNTFYGPANAAEPGTGNLIDTSDTRLTSAVGRTDPDTGAEAIWTQHAVGDADGGAVSKMRWYEVVPGAMTPVRQQGEVGDGVASYFNGAISPTKDGNEAVIDYTVSSSSIYPTMMATSRLSTTPLGTMSASQIVIKASTVADNDFTCTLSNGQSCRWGDYAGASPDLTNAHVVWVTNELTGTGGTPCSGTPCTGGSAGWATQNAAVTTFVACSNLAVGANPSSPQLIGTPVLLTATSSGCPNPRYEFWLLPPGGIWTLVQAYSATTTYGWTTTGKPAGAYLFAAWARDAISPGTLGSAPNTYDTAGTLSYSLTPPACTGLSASAAPPSPGGVGNTVVITATATGCPNPYPLYQFWLQPTFPAGDWTMVQAYSTSNTFNWNTNGKSVGTSYQFAVWARDAGSAGAYDQSFIVPYALTSSHCSGSISSVVPFSPASAGTPVTISFSAYGSCPNPLVEFWLLPPGGGWTLVQPYSSSTTFNWNTDGGSAGAYLFSVWIRDASSYNSYDTYSSTSYTLTVTTCTGLTATGSPLSPATVGTPVTITGNATGCNPRYQFWLLPPGGSWTVVQAYSSSTTFNWNATGLAAGSYLFSVWARDASSSSSYDKYSAVPYTLTVAPCTAMNPASAAPPSPAAIGTPVTVTAGSVTGCPNPRYQFWLLPPGGSWTVVQAYSSSTTFNWNTTGLAAGSYLFSVWARDASSSSSYDKYSALPYTLTVAPCTAMNPASAAPPSPAATGTPVTVTAGSVTGCPNPRYQFWLLPPGGSWTVVQAYSAITSFNWNTTGLAAGSYLFSVWARDASSSSSYDKYSAVPFTLN
jgi:hypothetical protein